MVVKERTQFQEFVCRVRGEIAVKTGIVALDPGETMGWAHFHNGTLQRCGEIQKEKLHLQALELEALIVDVKPTHLVVEDYRIYAGKLREHTWSSLYTPKLIGVIEFLGAKYELERIMQMASSKHFCTNEKLKKWGFYTRGLPHAMDAIRHGCYYLLFGRKGK